MVLCPQMKIVITHLPCVFIPNSVNSLLKTRADENDTEFYQKHSYTILILISTWIESMMYEMLISNLRLPCASDGQFHTRLVKEIAERIEDASLSEYQHLCKIVMGYSVDKIVGNENWKGIKTLYKFRNVAVHGRPIKYLADTTSLEPIKDRYVDVKKYLLEKGVIDPSQTLHSKNVVEHFLQVAKVSAIKLSEEIPPIVSKTSDGNNEFQYYSFSEAYTEFLHGLRF